MEDVTAVYLDVEDDITAIITKVRGSSAPVVALIAPKRSNVLQSAVNLKLIKKAAKEADKKVALITREPVLLSMAGRLDILVAPNLQTPPQVPEVTTPNNELPSDVIEADTEPATAPATETAPKPATAKGKASKAVAAVGSKIPLSKAAGKIKRIPDFDIFKKRFLLIGLGLIAVIVFWWLATSVWPSAVVTIKARTSNLDTAYDLTLDAEATAVDTEKSIIPAVTHEVSKTLTATFEPTTKKDIGSKASGQVAIENCYYTEHFSEERTIPAGTTFTASNGKKFKSTEAVTVPGAAFLGPTCYQAGEATVGVQAIENGDSYNLAPTSYAIEGKSNLDAEGGQMSGGSSKVVTVVSQKDINAARAKLLESEHEETEAELLEQFSDDERAIADTFTEDVTDVTTDPGIGKEASTAKLTLKVNYYVLGATNQDLETITEHHQQEAVASLNSELKTIIDNGLEQAEIKTANSTDDKSVRKLELSTQGLIGPDLDLDTLGQEVAGMEFNETVEYIKARPNVDQVDIKLSPFWVFTLPKNPEKITFSFEVQQ